MAWGSTTAQEPSFAPGQALEDPLALKLRMTLWATFQEEILCKYIFLSVNHPTPHSSYPRTKADYNPFLGEQVRHNGNLAD